MKTKIYLTAILVIAMAMFTACKKGDTGPAGAQGTPGTNGNANVIDTIFTVNVNAWDSVSTYEWIYTCTPIAALTAAVQSNAAIEVFFSDNNGGNWYALPFASYDGNEKLEFYTTVNEVVVFYYYNGIGTGDPVTKLGNNIKFKVVIIPH